MDTLKDLLEGSWELFEAPHDPTDRRVVVLADKYDEPIQDALRDVDGTCASLD